MPDALSCAQMSVFVDTLISDIQDLVDEQKLDSGRNALLDNAGLYNKRVCEWFKENKCIEESKLWKCEDYPKLLVSTEEET